MEFDTGDFEKAREILSRIMDEIHDVKELLDGAGGDVFFALGQSIGMTGKARALIARDIDQRRRHAASG
jgi:hypothetical protein